MGIGFSKYCNVIVEVIEEVKVECYLNCIFIDDVVFSDFDLSFVDFDSFSLDDFMFGMYN